MSKHGKSGSLTALDGHTKLRRCIHRDRLEPFRELLEERQIVRSASGCIERGHGSLHEAPQRIGHTLCCQRRCGGHEVVVGGTPRASLGDPALDEGAPEAFAARGARRLLREERIGQAHRQQIVVPAPPCRPLAAGVERLAAVSERLHDAVHHHVSRPGVESNDVLRSTPRRNRREIGDPAEIQDDAALSGASEEQPVRVGHERCAFAPGCHIRRAQIRDDADSGALGHHSRRSELERPTPRPAFTRALVEERLPRKPNAGHLGGIEVHRPQKLDHARGIGLAESVMELGDLGHSNRLSFGRGGEPATQSFWKGCGVMRLELPREPRRLAAQSQDHGVHAVERRPRHDAEQTPPRRPALGARTPLHFSAPATAPSWIWRWKKRNTASVGRAEIVEPAMSNPQSTPCSPCEKSAKPTGKVRSRSESTKMSGYRNEFQLMRNALIATTASAGRSSGNTIWPRIRYSLAPSTRAASSSSVGSPVTYWRIRKMLNASTAKGRMSAAYVLRMPRRENTRYNGIISTCLGSMSVASMATVRAREPQFLLRASA